MRLSQTNKRKCKRFTRTVGKKSSSKLKKIEPKMEERLFSKLLIRFIK